MAIMHGLYREAGVVTIDEDSCRCCGQCAEICPAAARPFVSRATYEQYRHFILPLAETYVAAHRNGQDALFYGAPALKIFHHSPYADHVDAAIACTYAMPAAESLDLGSTIIGGAPPILQRNKLLCRSLGIPEANTAALAMILGHPAVDFKRAIRRKFSSVHTLDGFARDRHPGEHRGPDIF